MENSNMQKYTLSLEALCRQARGYIVNMGQPTRREDNILRLAKGPQRSRGQPQDIVRPLHWASHILAYV